MTDPTLIGLAGYARVGKNTVGDILRDAHGYQQRAFADKLRELAWLAWPGYGRFVAEHGYEEAKIHFPEMRADLVALGAGARKVLGGDVWLDACLPNLHGAARRWWIANTPPTVITDVRYRNEAQRVVDLGGEVWYIFRPGVEAANDEEHRSISDLLSHVPVRVFINDHALVDLPYVVSRFLAHDPD